MAICFGTFWVDDNRTSASIPHESGLINHIFDIIKYSWRLFSDCFWQLNAHRMPNSFPCAQCSKSNFGLAVFQFNDNNFSKNRAIFQGKPNPICKTCLVTNVYISFDFCDSEFLLLKFNKVKFLMLSMILEW